MHKREKYFYIVDYLKQALRLCNNLIFKLTSNQTHLLCNLIFFFKRKKVPFCNFIKLLLNPNKVNFYVYFKNALKNRFNKLKP